MKDRDKNDPNCVKSKYLVVNEDLDKINERSLELDDKIPVIHEKVRKLVASL